MDDADDQHQVAFDPVEDAMPSMREAPQAIAQFDARCPSKRSFPEKSEHRVQTSQIGVGNLVAEFQKTIFANFDQVGARGGAQAQLSHSMPDAAR